jgi:DNA-directed RNA polymerase subunit RPC12/RpoP
VREMAYLCYKCKREYSVKEIKFTASNKYACVYCLGVVDKEQKKEVTQVQEETIEYICTSCSYKFSRKKSFLVKSCPYCNKETVTVKSVKNANALINESMDKNFDF